MIKTKNFNPKTDPKLLCTCGHPKCDRRSVDQHTLNNAQLIRDDIDLPMLITSGGRCAYHPNEVNKSKPGDHQKCKGIDVRYKTVVERNKLMALAGRHGATRVAEGTINGISFVHMAWSDTGDRSVPSWTY